MEPVSWIQIAYGLITLGTAAFGGWKAYQQKQAKQGLELTEDTLRALAAVIEMLPEDERTAKLKKQIKAAAEYIGTETDVLAPIVAQISDILESVGVMDGSVDAPTAARAAQVVKQAREARKAKVQ